MHPWLEQLHSSGSSSFSHGWLMLLWKDDLFLSHCWSQHLPLFRGLSSLYIKYTDSISTLFWRCRLLRYCLSRSPTPLPPSKCFSVTQACGLDVYLCLEPCSWLWRCPRLREPDLLRCRLLLSLERECERRLSRDVERERLLLRSRERDLTEKAFKRLVKSPQSRHFT